MYQLFAIVLKYLLYYVNVIQNHIQICIADIIIEDTRAGFFLAGIAGDAPSQRLIGDPYNFAVDTKLLQLPGHFRQSNGRVALLTGAAVYHQYLHMLFY